MKNFPLKEEIVFCQSQSSWPKYLTTESKVMDIRCTTLPARQTGVKRRRERTSASVESEDHCAKRVKSENMLTSGIEKAASDQITKSENILPISGIEKAASNEIAMSGDEITKSGDMMATSGLNPSEKAASEEMAKPGGQMTSPGEDPNQKEASTDGVIGRFESNPKEATASVEIAMVGEMLASYGLDPGQQAALVHALTSRLAIIQGPPGCGKTFVGLNLVKLLLSMEPRPPTPILVLTYKNHALDEFLKGLLSFLNIRDIVRIGGGSQVKELDACNLRNREKIKMDQRMLNEMNALRDNIRDAHEQVQENMNPLHEASLLTKQDLLDVWEERQLRQFLLAAPYRYGKKRRVEELVSSVPSGSNLLLKCLQEGGNTKEEEALFDAEFAKITGA